MKVICITIKLSTRQETSKSPSQRLTYQLLFPNSMHYNLDGHHASAARGTSHRAPRPLASSFLHFPRT